MTVTVLHLISLTMKIALLGGMVWGQLYFLRRAPAASRSRLCALALTAIVVLTFGEMLAPNWMVKAPVFAFTAVASARATQPAAAPLSWPAIIALVWLAGVAFLTLRGIVGRTALAIVRRRSTPLEQTSGVDVRSAAVQTPILSGWLRPTILLPETARSWTAEQRSMVLTHELTHFRQGDSWTNLLAQIVRAAFWFHPAVWLLIARLSREQELTCDEAVVASGHSRHDYAAFLLQAARNLQSREMFACAMAGSGARSLKQRFANLLDMRPRPVLTRRVAVSLASFALVAATLMMVRPAMVRPVLSQSNGKVYKVGGDVTSPKVLKKVEPSYTQEDKAAKIQGPVRLKAIVTPVGTADSIEVTQSLSPGLDQKAIDALSQWTFQPATKDGKPVPVWVTVEVNFKLM